MFTTPFGLAVGALSSGTQMSQWLSYLLKHPDYGYDVSALKAIGALLLSGVSLAYIYLLRDR